MIIREREQSFLLKCEFGMGSFCIFFLLDFMGPPRENGEW